MTNYILTIVDSGGIQEYIFGSNKLKQNLAASYLVNAATRDWVKDSLDEIKVKHNIVGFDIDDPFSDEKIESGNIDAEVIMAGGGNTQILFRDLDTAKNFSRTLSKKVLEEAPGLKITIIHKSFDWDKEMLGGANGVIDQIMKELARRKARINPLPPLLGLGVTAQDIYTGLPVTEMNDGEGVSAEIAAKLDVVEKANERLKNFLKDVEGLGNYNFASKFEEMGQKEGESNYIAVVHADGNGMGNRIQAVGQMASDNRDYITKMRAFSRSIRQAAVKTLKATVEKLMDAVEDKDFRKHINVKDGVLPFRPIVFGGDDITFVTEGRLGLTLAAFYLQKFRGEEYADGKPAYVRAGVAVVKSHFPFARAYELAEALARSAKARIKEVSPEGEAVAMDWHFASLGPIFSLGEIREREYTTHDGKSLLMRPVLFGEYDDWRTWKNLKNLVKAFNENEEWRERHNKVMHLRSALRQGPEAVDRFRKAYSIERLPAIENLDEKVQETGWVDGQCGYFDAIETKDFFIPIEQRQGARQNA